MIRFVNSGRKMCGRHLGCIKVSLLRCSLDVHPSSVSYKYGGLFSGSLAARDFRTFQDSRATQLTIRFCSSDEFKAVMRSRCVSWPTYPAGSIVNVSEFRQLLKWFFFWYHG